MKVQSEKLCALIDTFSVGGLSRSSIAAASSFPCPPCYLLLNSLLHSGHVRVVGVI